MGKYLLKCLKVLWAAPNSLLGLVIGGFGLLTGARAQAREGCIEFYGGLVKLFLNNVPPGKGVAGMTLGHVILGLTPEVLDRVREHEQVHVRQYERWGPFFLVAYFGCSLVLWFQRKDPYLDNPFEVEAYEISDPRH